MLEVLGEEGGEEEVGEWLQSGKKVSDKEGEEGEGGERKQWYLRPRRCWGSQMRKRMRQKKG